MARRRKTAGGGRRRSSSIITVDFTGVDRDGGGGFLIPDGNYRMKLTAAEKDTSSKDEDMIVWDFKGLEGKAKNKAFRYWTSLQEQALWKLAAMLEAMGVEVPDSSLDIDIADIVGEEPEVIGVVEADTYRGKERSKLMDVISLDEAGEEADDDDDDDDDKGRGKKKKGAKPRKRGGRTAKVSADDVKEMDEDELQDLIDKHELDVDLSDYKTPRRKAAAVIEALEDAGALED